MGREALRRGGTEERGTEERGHLLVASAAKDSEQVPLTTDSDFKLLFNHCVVPLSQQSQDNVWSIQVVP